MLDIGLGKQRGAEICHADGGPCFQRYFILDTSDKMRCNSIGAGMADFGTNRLFGMTDSDAFYPNAFCMAPSRPWHREYSVPPGNWGSRA